MSLLKGFHKHHVIPRHAGGDNSLENLVLLHPIDHAIAHFVRWKLTGNSKDAWAYNRVIAGCNDKTLGFITGFSRDYMRKPKSAATKAKISIATKGKHVSAATIAKIKHTLTGRPAIGKSLEALHAHRHLAWAPEAQRKKSMSLQGRDISAWVHKIADANRGKVRSVETKAKMSEAHKGYKQTSEQVAKRVAARRATLEAKKLVQVSQVDVQCTEGKYATYA